MKSAPLLALALILSLAPCSQAAPDRVAEASSGQVPDPDDQVFFPLDDVSLPWRDNLKLTLHRPAKYPGNPVMRPGPVDSPDGYAVCLYGTVIKEEGKFRMWYLAWPRPDERIPGDVEDIYRHRPIAYAESTDGVHWSRPNLGLFSFRGSRNNNLVRIEPADKAYSIPWDFVAVLHEPSDPDPARRYKMAYITDEKARGYPPSTATAVSPDGLRWTLVNTEMFTKGDFENTSLVRFEGLYYLSGQNHPPFNGSLSDGTSAGRVMKIFFSPDFTHWSNGRALAFYRADNAPRLFGSGNENHMGAGLWNRGNILLGLYGRWNGGTYDRASDTFLKGVTLELGLVVSNDAVHYREPVRNFVLVHRGTDGDWDAGGVVQGNAFANTDTQTLIWYRSDDTAKPFKTPTQQQGLPERVQKRPDCVGLLTLPRDRFGSFSKLLEVSQERNPKYNVKRDASCLSRSLVLQRPSRLSVNLDEVSPGAALTLALVDDAERPLPGYTASLGQSGLKVPVVWAGGSAELPVKAPFRVKVTWPVDVNQAKLYALYIEHD